MFLYQEVRRAPSYLDNLNLIDCLSHACQALSLLEALIPTFRVASRAPLSHCKSSMSLPPQLLRIKRKRDVEPVDSLCAS